MIDCIMSLGAWLDMQVRSRSKRDRVELCGVQLNRGRWLLMLGGLFLKVRNYQGSIELWLY